MKLLYRDFNDRCAKIRNKSGDQQDLEFSKFVDWSIMSPRDKDDPDKLTGTIEDHIEQPGATYADFYMSSPLEHVLDFGASSSGTQGGFMRKFSHNYYTLDNDADSESNFKSFGEIPEDLKFNGIIASHVLEHIDREELPDIIESLSRILVKDGIILAIVPNVYNWPRFIRDLDHRSFLDYSHVGAIFSMFNIEVIDSYLTMRNAKSFVKLCDELESDSTKAYLVNFLNKTYGIHPASDVVIVGIKREGGTSPSM